MDIGTGYFVQKDVGSSRKFLENKLELVQGNTSKVAEIVKQKKKLLDETQMMLQAQVAAYKQQQAGE